MNTVPKPKTGDFPAYFGTYINLVENENILEEMESVTQKTFHFFETLEDKSLHTYAEGKWNIRQILQHLIDTDAIFLYRALRFIRMDPTALPGFDQDLYAKNDPQASSYKHLLTTFLRVRQISLLFFGTFSEKDWAAFGTASDHKMTVAALAYSMTGHSLHHIKVIEERYL